MHLNFTTLTQKHERRRGSSKRAPEKDGKHDVLQSYTTSWFHKNFIVHTLPYCGRNTRKWYASAHTRTGGGKRAWTHRERSRTLAPNARLSPSHCPSLWWNRGCHAVTVRSRRTNKCFPPRRWDLNGKATWQLCSERPHNQTPHPERRTSTSVQEASPTRRFTHLKCAVVQSPGDVGSVGECAFVLGKIVVVGIFSKFCLCSYL